MTDTPSLERILADLISFKTVSRTENIKLIEYLERFLTPLGFTCQRIEHPQDAGRANLLCSIGPDRPGGLMLSGHTDVVPVLGQDWHSDPFTLKREDDRYVGRGVTDMKGFLAASLFALKSISRKKFSKPLTLLWTYDEEIGCQGSAVAAPKLKDHLKYLPQAALIGEPTDFSILRMHSGHATVVVKAKGKGAHSSDPSLGKSAIKAINQAMNGLFELEQELIKERSMTDFFRLPFVSMNVGEIHGGTAVNIIPDEAVLTLGFRPLPDTNVQTIVERIDGATKKYLAKDGATLSTELKQCSPAMMTKSGSDLESALKDLAQKGPESAAFSTDAGNLSQQGIDCLVFGPGSIDVAHQANEWVKIASVESAVGKINAIIDRWCS